MDPKSSFPWTVFYIHYVEADHIKDVTTLCMMIVTH